MSLPALIDALTGHSDWQVFLASAGLTMFIGISLILTMRGSDMSLGIREAFILTIGSWLGVTLFASLPFAFAELNLSFADAFFEAMSGITTTGATVIVNLDQAPPGILLWRALLQWLGGIGIIVTAVALLPMLKVGGMQLFRMESSDTTEKILQEPLRSQLQLEQFILYLPRVVHSPIGLPECPGLMQLLIQ